MLCVCGDAGHLRESGLRSQKSPDIALTGKISGTGETQAKRKKKGIILLEPREYGESVGKWGHTQICLRINPTGVDSLLNYFSRGRAPVRTFERCLKGRLAITLLLTVNAYQHQARPLNSGV